MQPDDAGQGGADLDDIHAYGPVTFSEDATALLDVVTRLTARHEAEREAPWAPSDAPAPFIQCQLKGIVAAKAD